MPGDIPGRSSRSRNEEVTGKDCLALTIGTFDGVHIGHQLLLRVTREIAEVRNIESAAYTYELPPKRYLDDSGPKLVMDPGSKVDYLESFLDRTIVGDFHDVRTFTPEQFVEKVLVEELNVDAVVVGDDWRFGKDRSGSYRDLEELSKGRFTVHPQRQVTKNGKPVSSTWIRKELGEGNLELARELLGRYPGYSGEVVRGHQLGTDLGFPTANIELDKRVVLPRRGNYAAFTEIDGRRIKGAVHIGNRPTFGGEENHQVEIHLFDFNGELYDERLTVWLVKYLDRNREYSDKGELRQAIRGYVDEAKRVLEEVDSLK